MAVNIHITIIELNALHTKRQNLFQELDAVIHLIILTLSVSRLLNLLLRLVAFLLFLNPQCLASISRWITASSSWKRFCLFVCRALSRSEERRVGKECRCRGSCGE